MGSLLEDILFVETRNNNVWIQTALKKGGPGQKN